jgi:ADP-ribosylglycohydrolase
MGVAIGDTLGRPFEGILREKIHLKFNDFEQFINDNKKLFNTYTDDTQLTLHTAQALIEGNGFVIDNFIGEYVKWLDDPPIGAGYGCISSIRKLKYGISWEEAASNSGGNGTVMRISPIGLFYNKHENKLKDVAIKTSRITHSHPGASAGAVTIARAIAFLVDKTPNRGFELEEFFRSILFSLSNVNNGVWKELTEILEKVKNSLNLSIESGLIKFSQAGVQSPYFIENYIGKAFVHPYALSTVACAIFIFLKSDILFTKNYYFYKPATTQNLKVTYPISENTYTLYPFLWISVSYFIWLWTAVSGLITQ